MEVVIVQILKSCEIYLYIDLYIIYVCSVKRKDCRREIYIGLCERGLRYVAMDYYLICLKCIRSFEDKDIWIWDKELR